MTLDEKIGQMLTARAATGAYRALDSDEVSGVRRAILEHHVGAVHAGIGDAATIAVTLNEFQRIAKVPLLTTSNLEGGAGYVLYGATRMPLAMAIAATGDEQLAYEAGKITAIEGRALGVNVNFYPVVDVNNNPRNPIINIRSFGEDPAKVSRFASAYIRGIQEHGQLATAKHFPGHGDVEVDSHLAMPVLDVSRERLDAIELPPFRAAIDAGIGAIMSAHIWLPRLESENDVPATLSRNLLTNLLRSELAFDGLIVTDSMGMRGVTATFQNEDATLRAVEAGADLLIGLPNVERSFEAIRSAVAAGRISAARVEASARRVLEAKAGLGLMHTKNRFADSSALMTSVGTKPNRAVAQTIADRAITLVHDRANVLPLRPDREKRVVQINLVDTRSGWREGPVGRVVATELQKRFPRAVTIQIDDESTDVEYELTRKAVQFADALVVNAFVRVASYKGSIALDEKQLQLVLGLIATEKPLVFQSFGSPYVISSIPGLPSYIVTYDTSPTAEMAAVKALSGEIEYRGTLPITLPGGSN